MAKNRISKLVSENVLALQPTGMQSPRSYIVYGIETREYLHELHGKKVWIPAFKQYTYHHQVLEQIAFYWINKIRRCTRTTVNQNRSSSRQLHHVPDFYYRNENKKVIYVEAERTKKSPRRYVEIMQNMIKDNVGGVLYVTNTEKEMVSLAKSLPTWDKLYLTTIDQLKDGVEKHNEISAQRQKFILRPEQKQAELLFQ